MAAFLPQHNKWSFQLRISSVNVTKFTEEILNWKLRFLCIVRERCKRAGTLLNLSGSLFCKCDSMYSTGINLLVNRGNVRLVMGTFTEAALTSMSDLLLISSVTLPIRHRCLGALSLCINTTSLTLIYGELLFNDLNFCYSRIFEVIDNISQFFSVFINIYFFVYWWFW